jgi:hypothetical protein
VYYPPRIGTRKCPEFINTSIDGTSIEKYDSPMPLSPFDRIDNVVFPLCPPIPALDSSSSSERHPPARGKAFPFPLPLVTVARKSLA